MSSLIHWWARNHLAANFLMLAIFLGGFFVWKGQRKEIFPEIATNFITVSVPYPNATPEEVEKGAVIPVEEAIQDLEGIKRITSNSNESVGTVVVEGQDDYDMDTLVNKIKSRVDGIRNLAENTEKAIISVVPIKSQILSIALTAPTDEKGLRTIADQLRDQLLGLKEVSQVEVAGARRHEISVEVSEKVLRELGITFDHVADALRQSSLDLPAGSVKTAGGEVLIRTAAKRYSAKELNEVTVLTRSDGSKVSLGELATVQDGFEEVEATARFDGRNAIVLDVYRTGDEDTLEVAGAVKEYLKTAERTLPEGTKLEVWNDLSLMLQGRMDLMMGDAVGGFILVGIMLTLFLRPILAFHVALGIPIAFFGGVMLMPLGGVTINMISLFAFIIVLGIVTDDAIVVGENVYERMRKGEPARLAAPRGTYEVMVVAIFGVLTVVCSFLPMLGISGVSGEIWKNIPWVVIPVLLISLVETNLILPAHLAHLKPEKPYEEINWFLKLQRRITHRVDVFVDGPYKQLLAKAIKNRYLTLASFVAVAMLVVGYVLGGFLKFEFFPRVEGEVVCAKLTLANGTASSVTAQAIERMEKAAMQLNEIYARTDGKKTVVHTMAHVGSQPFKLGFQPPGGGVANNIGEVTLELIEAAERDITADLIVSKWRELVGPIPGVVDLTFFANTSRTGNAFDLEFHGPDQAELARAVAAFKTELGKFSGVTDISDNNREGKQELRLEITPQGEAAGLRLGELSRQVRQGFYGEEVQRLQRGRDEVKVMVRYPQEERLSQHNLDQMRIRMPDGRELPFSEVATSSHGRGYANIYRAERQRAIRVSADIDKKVPGANSNEIVQQLEETVFPKLKRDFASVSHSFQGEQKDQRQSMSELGTGFKFCLVGIFVLLAIPLRSLMQPIIVMSVIPFGAVGAVIGHIIFGVELSIMSMIGIVALSGVVVNESLVLVEYVNRHRRAGSPIATAARDAGCARFQAIMLTSITSFIGVMPIILETSLQAKFLVPCGISLAFGCLFNMLNTLVLVPCVYAILEDLRKKIFTAPKLQEMEALERIEAAERGLGWE